MSVNVEGLAAGGIPDGLVHVEDVENFIKTLSGALGVRRRELKVWILEPGHTLPGSELVSAFYVRYDDVFYVFFAETSGEWVWIPVTEGVAVSLLRCAIAKHGLETLDALTDKGRMETENVNE